MSNIKDTVFAAMDGAVDDGYHQDPLTPEQIETLTLDLMDCDGNLKDADMLEVEEVITQWAQMRDLYAPDRTHFLYTFHIHGSMEVISVRASTILHAQDIALLRLGRGVHLTFILARR